jgi:hypothetical protein
MAGNHLAPIAPAIPVDRRLAAGRNDGFRSSRQLRHSSSEDVRCGEPLNLAIPILGVIDDLFLRPLLLHGLAKIAAYATTLQSSRSRDDRVVSVQ